MSLAIALDLEEVTNRRLLFDAGWLRLYERVTKVRGRLVRWVYCSRGKLDGIGRTEAVVVVPFVATSEGVKILITKEFRSPLNCYEHGFPSGLIDPGESVETTCARELEEETGYRVKRILERSPGGLVSSAGLSDETFQYFLVEAEEGAGQRLETSELIEVMLLSLSELGGLFKSDAVLSGRLWALCHGFLTAGAFPMPAGDS